MPTSNRRMRERGAVFVEAVVIISFLTLALLGITFFHKLYVQKERSARLAGAAAIAFAMGACNGDATASIKSEMPKGQSGNSTQNNEPPPPEVPDQRQFSAVSGGALRRRERGQQLSQSHFGRDG